VLAQAGANITDLTTRLSGELYVLVAEVDIPLETDVVALRERLEAAAARIGVGVTLRPADAELM
jgi:glycine cleavage system transcriptional repressor